MMWKIDFSGETWTLQHGQHWVISGPVASGKTLLTSRLARRYTDSIALLTFNDQATAAGSAWTEARWHGSIEYDFRTVDSVLSYEAIHCVSPFEVRPPEIEERKAFHLLRQWLEESLHLKPLLKKWTVHLSNGEQRRLLLARAILRQTPVLILDDPYAGLDETMRVCLTNTLTQLVQRGKTIVLTVRNEDEIPPFITHRLTLEDCRIRSQAPYQPQKNVAKRLTIQKNPPSLQTPCILSVQNLTHVVGGKKLFNKLNWEVHQGERWVITGENGAGKTTLFSLISGDNPFAYACDIERFGQRLGPGVPLWQIRSQIASVSPEAQTLLDHGQTIESTVFSGIFDKTGMRLSPTTAQRKLAHRLLTALGLYERFHDTLGTLSAGLIRLVLIVRALVAAPRLLLLDEPCLNLEPTECKKMLHLISQLFEELPELTVLCIAHRSEHIPAGFHYHLHLTNN